MDVKLYEFDPLGVFSETVGGTITYTGPGTPQGSATITDNGAGIEALFLDDIAGETATATTTIGGNTDASNAQVYAEECWTLIDQTTGQQFQLITFRINTGTNVGYYTLSEIPLVVGRVYETVSYDTVPDASAGDESFRYADYVESDGIVEGTGGDDVIDGSYVGDPGNDQIDQSFTADTALDFNWSGFADEQDLRGGVTQNVGGINVSVSYSDVQTTENFSAELSGGADAIYVAAGETFSTTSAGYLFANGSPDNSEITFDFAAIGGSGLDGEVENVRFRISDIDGLNDGTNNFQDIVTIRAYDANGVEVAVTITGGTNLSVTGNTITAALTNFSPASAEASALIEIAGPVAQIVVIYDNGGTTQQAIYFSDIQFDAVPLDSNDDTVSAGAGNDVIDSGFGDDSVDGGTGNDTIFGGAGADTLSGGADDDTIHVGEGDVATGGDGDDTFIIDDTQLGGGAINITGGEGDETTGDLLDFNGQLLVGSMVLTEDGSSPTGKSGTATLLDGTIVTFSEIERIICFADGTRIDTPCGPRAIETLEPGDLVLTRDHGPQPLRWMGRKTVVGAGALAPIEFAPGSIGNKELLRVSPQHRMLVDDYRAELYFGSEEVLAAADFLVNGETILRREVPEVTYFHLLFDTHQLIRAAGVWSESFHPAGYGIASLSDNAREALFDLRPDLRSNPGGYGRAARMSVKRHEAFLLAA